MRIKNIKLWAVLKNGKIDPWSISPEKEYVLEKDEKLIRVLITKC